MSTYLLVLVWGGFNVYLASALAWMFYRLGHKSGFAQCEREAALAAMAGAAGITIHAEVVPCQACPGTAGAGGKYSFHRRNCENCDAATGQHIHLECKNCGYKYIVQPQ